MIGTDLPLAATNISTSFLIREVDLLPFLNYWGIIILAWVVSLVLVHVFNRKAGPDLWLLVLPGAGLLGFTFKSALVIWIGALLFLVIVVRLILLIHSFFQGKVRPADIGLLSVYASVVLFFALSVPLANRMASDPQKMVSQLGTRSEVIETKLLFSGRRAVPALVSGLLSDEPRKASACARLLRQVDGEIPLTPIYRLLSRNGGTIISDSPRIEAARTLAVKADQSSIEPMLKAAYDNLKYLFRPGKEKLRYNRSFHRVIILAVKRVQARTGVYNAADLAYRHSTVTTDPFQISTWGLIGVELGGTQSLESLKDIFGRIYKTGKMKILNSLEDHTSSESLNLLFRALKDSSAMVRRRALSLLAERREIIAVYYVVRVLDDPVRSVRNEAHRALVEMTGQEIPYDPDGDRKSIIRSKALWLRWWAKKARE